MKLTIRQAELLDEQAIRSFLESVIPKSLKGQGHDLIAIAENVSSNVDSWVADPTRSLRYVAEENGEIVGDILLKDYWNLCSLFVQPEFHNHGIGQALVETVLKECRGKNPKNAVYLVSNDSAVRFYQKLGFGPREVSQPPPAGSTPMMLSF
tara:strand:- start:20177 stop:20632 length:456 start_codon:yes stop_codon:yes gene_type:complete